MSESLPPSSSAAASSAAVSAPAAQQVQAKRRRRWPVWLLLAVLLIIALIVSAPYVVAYPAVRDRWLGWLSSRVNLRFHMGSLSLGWFSPVVVGDLKIQTDEAHQAALEIQELRGDTPLWRLLFSHDAGTFQLERPQMNLEFDAQGSNLGRVFGALAQSAFFSGRAVRWEIVDGRFSLRGPSSPRAWTIDKLNLNMTVAPATQNVLGVPTLRGGQARLLNQTELTPEMCNDLLKYIAPVLSHATTTSGRVSLVLDEFTWPLGKPEAAALKGTLTLHSVETGPGELLTILAGVLELKGIPTIMQIAKDDDVAFNMHDGRIYHDNLAFRLAGLQGEPWIRSHGSVGLDETLDWFLDFPALGTALPADSALRGLLSQLKLHVVGTLASPKLSAPALKAISDWMERRRSEKQDDPTRPSLLPGRRSAIENPPAPATGPPK